MVVIVRQGAEEAKIQKLTQDLENLGVSVQRIDGSDTTILGLVGDTSAINPAQIEMNDIVERITRVQEPYKKANRKFHPDDSVLEIAGNKVGGKELTIIAGPCSVESEEQILNVAREVQAAGATFLRGGAFKPRTSPYAFQGMGLEGLDLLKIAKRKTGLPIVTEIMDVAYLDRFIEDVDIIQVGARNMQNFALLKQLSHCNKAVMIKRGLSSTLEELLMAAEYVMAGGNNRVILCERGIRTFETATRNTLDLSAVPMLKKMTHLPVIIDPSHATGQWWMVEPMAKAAVAAGANGIMVEVHPNPPAALCDGAQSITPEKFTELMRKVDAIARIEGRSIRGKAQ